MIVNWHRDRPKYVCKRFRLLEFLVKRGFYPEKTLPDYNNPRYNVWIFDNSPELADAIDEFLLQQENREK